VSVAVPSQSVRRQRFRVLRHFASTRGVEVGALQASPLLGAYLGGLGFGDGDAIRWLLLLVGSTVLTASIFVFNDWVDYDTDARDPRRARLGPSGNGIMRGQIAGLALGLAILAAAALAALGPAELLIGAAIAFLGLMYSASSILGKRTPGTASLNHLLGGTLHFLLGYEVAHVVDARGVAIGLFFGLVFAAGHFNQEVRDHEADRANGTTTSAVVFGPRRAFLASFCLFSAAYGLIIVLSLIGALPATMLLVALAWLLHGVFSQQALRRGPGLETALWMQSRYRLLFALVGLAMLVH
jgi:4-hydroxybenzoate polyprenyltransferase